MISNNKPITITAQNYIVKVIDKAGQIKIFFKLVKLKVNFEKKVT
jgi:hypothetical protein